MLFSFETPEIEKHKPGKVHVRILLFFSLTGDSKFPMLRPKNWVQVILSLFFLTRESKFLMLRPKKKEAYPPVDKLKDYDSKEYGLFLHIGR